jgi:hypothetical protein
MKQSLNLKNSIYQQRPNGSYSGLTVNDGMLINDRPDGRMGITKAVEMKKAIQRAEKISTMSTAFALGEMSSDMGESCCD